MIGVPTASGRKNSSRPPAHMRRGSGTGGRKPPRRVCPSGPISLCLANGVKYSQCQSGGTGSPGCGIGSSRSSVAASAAIGAAVATSRRSSTRPIQSCHGPDALFAERLAKAVISKGQTKGGRLQGRAKPFSTHLKRRANGMSPNRRLESA